MSEREAPSLEETGLEVLPFGTILAKSHRSIQAAAQKYDEFPRAIRLVVPETSTFETIGEILEAGDREFEAIADFCGGVVVKHEWKLAQRRNMISTHRTRPFLPIGYELAAVVESLENVEPITQDHHAYEQAANGLRDYFLSRSVQHPEGHMLADHGMKKTEQLSWVESRGGLHVTDIDMVFNW